MSKIIMVALFVLMSVASFGEPIKYDPTGEEPHYKAGDVLPDGRLVGTPEGELPVTQADLAEKLRQSYACNDEANRQQAAGNRKQAVYLQNISLTLVTEVKQSLSPEQFVALLKEVSSGPATWGKAEYQRAINDRLIRGRTPGVTPGSAECKEFARREELATVAVRAVSLADFNAGQRVDTHDDSPYVHKALIEREHKYVDEKSKPGVWALWGLVGLVVLLLLISLVRALYRALTRPMPVAPAAVAVYPAGGMVVPVAPGGGAPAPAGPAVVLPAFVPYGNGMQNRTIMG